MNYLFIIPVIAIATFVFLYFASKNAVEIKEEDPPKFEPRKMTIVLPSTETPKKKKKRYYNKKKPVVAKNAPTEKRPVGRPRKTD